MTGLRDWRSFPRFDRNNSLPHCLVVQSSVLRPLFVLLFVTVATLATRGNATAQSTVESTFLPGYGEYQVPHHWSPAEVPNNSSTRRYNIQIAPGRSVTYDGKLSMGAGPDATVSSAVFEGSLVVRSGTLSVEQTTFLATEPTTFYRGTAISVISTSSGGATFNAGTLSSYADGTLTGSYSVQAVDGPAVLRFRGADVNTLQSASVDLRGSAAQLLDEAGQDALRSLAHVDLASGLNIYERSLTTTSPLMVEGFVSVTSSYSSTGTATLFSAASGLRNFDSATRTIRGGSFSIDGLGGSAPAEFRFPSGDIVTNGSAIKVLGASARMADLSGQDALRNLAHNLPDGSLHFSHHSRTVPGDFTNEGRLSVLLGSFAVTGRLQNYHPTTRTLRGGSYELSAATLRIPGADIEHNAASIVLGYQSKIVDGAGNDALRNLAVNTAEGELIIGTTAVFTTASGFSNYGRLETFPGVPPPRPWHPAMPSGEFSVAAGSAYTQLAGATVNSGVLRADRVEISGGALSGNGAIHGNVTVTDAAVSPGGYIRGDLTLAKGSRVQSVAGRYGISSWQVDGAVLLGGALEFQPSGEMFLDRNTVLTLLQSTGPVSGKFDNAPAGARVATVDGSGSFVVLYEANAVKLTDFHPNPPPAQLLNISARAFRQPGASGDGSLIGGLIISGTTAKTVMLRAIGPSLQNRGVSEALPDPVLRLMDSAGDVLDMNDNWIETQKEAIESSGLAPTHPNEAAIQRTLEPGAYTIVVDEKSNTGGNALVEVYDLSAEADGRLANLSTRGYVDADNFLIGGIIVRRGEGNAEVVVRALGPALRAAGVENALDDPTLELRNSDGALIAANDDWYANREQFDSPGLPSLQPQYAKESAMRVSVPVGEYTAIVGGKDGRGAALVEFYDLRR